MMSPADSLRLATHSDGQFRLNRKRGNLVARKSPAPVVNLVRGFDALVSGELAQAFFTAWRAPKPNMTGLVLRLIVNPARSISPSKSEATKPGLQGSQFQR